MVVTFAGTVSVIYYIFYELRLGIHLDKETIDLRRGNNTNVFRIRFPMKTIINTHYFSQTVPNSKIDERF